MLPRDTATGIRVLKTVQACKYQYSNVERECVVEDKIEMDAFGVAVNVFFPFFPLGG